MSVGPDRLLFFFAACYFGQGMAGLIYEPLSYLLKDGLGLSPAESSSFIAWMTAPFLIKPLFGFVSDALPLEGRRRRPHLILASLLWAGGLAALALLETPSYGRLLSLLLLVNAGTVLADAACDGVMVEQGLKKGRTGVYQAVQLAALYLSLVATGLGGGWLAAHASPSQVFALAAVFPALLLLSIAWVREGASAPAAHRSLAGLRLLLKNAVFWRLALLIFLWSFAPFLGTAQFYYQSQTLGFGPVFIGGLSTAAGAAGFLGAAAFPKAQEKLGPEGLLKAAVWVWAPLQLFYLAYRGPASALALTVLFSLFGTAFRLALMDLAARSCPKGAEAAAFALYMAVFNAAAWTSNTAGGWLYEHLGVLWGAHGAAGALAVLGGAATLCAAPMLRALTGRFGGRPDSAS